MLPVGQCTKWTAVHAAKYKMHKWKILGRMHKWKTLGSCTAAEDAAADEPHKQYITQHCGMFSGAAARRKARATS